ncbi:nitroreductase family protein [Streptomyces sp. NPDC016566]|uniref:nitroreductase family protein n=1 Tax=Streptomyces sp. NPDC016566 TaxID=3364967 RepID=UPI0036FA7A96
MDVFTTVLTRRSVTRPVAPAPGDEKFRYLLQMATAPDDGTLRPWWRILVCGEGQDTVVNSLAEETPNVPRQQFATKVVRHALEVVRAALKARLVLRPRPGHRVPECEQLATAHAMARPLLLLLHTRGYGAIWRTGLLRTSLRVPRRLGFGTQKRLPSALDIGSPDPAAAPQRRPTPLDVSDHVATLV